MAAAAAISAPKGQAWHGGDYDKVWINTRGEYNDKARSLERAELQVLYSRLVGYFFDAQIGVRQDFPIRPNDGTPARTHLVIGLQGLLPGLLEVNAQFFVDQHGTVAARVEGFYNAYVTQRLVLQPQVELKVAANADRQSRTGTGLTRIESGLRLRYEVTREFAPTSVYDTSGCSAKPRASTSGLTSHVTCWAARPAFGCSSSTTWAFSGQASNDHVGRAWLEGLRRSWLMVWLIWTGGWRRSFR